MHKLPKSVTAAGFFVLVTVLFFLPVFTNRTVPIPLNLLVSYYSPWRYDGYKEANKAIGFDNVRQMLPYKQFTKESVSFGHMPLWNPSIFAGNPHIASLQPAFFYPGTILLDLLLPLIDSWTIMVLIQPIIAGLLTYLFLRELKLSVQASLIGAMSFAFCGWMITWWEEFLIVVHSIIWLPLALLGSLHIWNGRTRRGTLYLILALTLSVFAGFTQSTLYLGMTTIAWNTFLWWDGRKKISNKVPIQSAILHHPMRFVLLSVVITILLTSVQWIPTWEAYVLSPRARDDASYIFSVHLLPVTHLITLFAPDFWGNPGTYNAFGNTGFYHERIVYLGIVPLFLALMALIHDRNKHALFWKYFTLITFSMVFALPTGWLWYWLRVPFLSAMQPTRIMMIASFGWSVLAAYGFEKYSKTGDKKLVYMPMIIILLLAFAAWGWLGWTHIIAPHCPHWSDATLLFCPNIDSASIPKLPELRMVTFRNLILPSAGVFVLLLIALSFYKHRTALFIALVLLHMVSMGYFARKYLYFSERSNMYPVTPVLRAIQDRIGNDRVWSYGNASMENNILSYFAIPTPEGYAPFFPRAYGELIGAIERRGAIDTTIARSDVTLKHADEVETMTDNPFRLRMMSLLAVKYIMETKNGENKDRRTTEERFPSDVFTISWENENWRLWEYKNALPRAFLVNNAVVATSTAQYTDILFNPNTSLAGTIVLDEKPDITLHSNSLLIPNKNAVIRSYEPNTVIIDTYHDSPAMLFLSDSYYPGWKAYVDKKETKIYRADYAFRAVGIPAGNHTVEFRYEPESWKWGLLLSGVGLMTLGFFWIYSRTSSKK